MIPEPAVRLMAFQFNGPFSKTVEGDESNTNTSACRLGGASIQYLRHLVSLKKGDHNIHKGVICNVCARKTEK